MKKPAASVWAICFIIITAVDIAAIWTGISIIHFAMKPLLMLALLLWLFFTKTAINEKSMIATGLFFSWLGDVLLLFDNKDALFFIGGLISFLITHICYIIYFLKIRSERPSLIRKQPWIAALVAGYGVSLVMLLLPHLGALKIPVIIYAIVICNMLLFSLHVFNRINKPSNVLFITGALLFAASDSVLAIHKFYKPFPAAAVLIMLTYCAAQFCIVLATIKRRIIAD